MKVASHGARRNVWIALALAGPLIVAAFAACRRESGSEPASTTAPSPPSRADLPPAIVQHIQDFCSKCHAYPPPHTFPRSAWQHEVEQGYKFFAQSKLELTPPAMNDTLRYYK